MKKMMIAAICMMMISMSCMAYGKGYNNHDNKGNEPKVEMNERGGRNEDNHCNDHKGCSSDQIIDMNAIHRLDLSMKQMKKVESLKERCDREMHKLCAKHDKKQIDKASEKYEKELKKILGHDNYKRYEFLTNDHLAMNNDHHGNDKGHDGNNRGGNSTTIVAHGRR